MTHRVTYHHLCSRDRTHIALRIADRFTDREIACELGVDRGTIRREIKRNGGRHSYNAEAAQARADKLSRRPGRLLDQHPLLAVQLVELMEGRRSVRQALHLSAKAHPELPRVSHETVYTWAYAGHTELHRRAQEALRRPRRRRRCRTHDQAKHARIKDMTPISERPADVDTRSTFGHWEGDLVVGAGGQSALLTLVERRTRQAIVAKLATKTAAEVEAVLASVIRAYPPGTFLSITWDQGTELAAHAKLTAATGVPVYFCEPHSPWQRGTNENTNGVLRWQYPKGTDFRGVTAESVACVEAWLNTRPMPTLSGATPTEAFAQELAALGV